MSSQPPKPDARLTGRALSCVRDDRTLFTGLGFGVDTGEALIIGSDSNCPAEIVMPAKATS